MGSIEQQRRTHPNQGDYEWTKGTTKNGKTFEVGRRLKSEAPVRAISDDENAAKEGESGPWLSAGPAFKREVNWEVDDTWHDPPQWFVSDTSLQSYCVGHSSNWIYDYYIEIAPLAGYNYHFTDKTGDRYQLNIWNDSFPQTHIVRYNSDDPAIQLVEGE